MRKLGILEVLTKVGEDNIRLQNLIESCTGAKVLKNGDTQLTVLTNQITPGALIGNSGKMGLILWLPREDIKRIYEEFAAGAEPK